MSSEKEILGLEEKRFAAMIAKDFGTRAQAAASARCAS